MAPTTALAPSASACGFPKALAVLATTAIAASSLGASAMQPDIPGAYRHPGAGGDRGNEYSAPDDEGPIPSVAAHSVRLQLAADAGAISGGPINPNDMLMAPTPGSAALAGVGTFLIAVRRRR